MEIDLEIDECINKTVEGMEIRVVDAHAPALEEDKIEGGMESLGLRKTRVGGQLELACNKVKQFRRRQLHESCRIQGGREGRWEEEGSWGEEERREGEGVGGREGRWGEGGERGYSH